MVFFFSRIHSDIINTQLPDLRFPGVSCSGCGGDGARDGKKDRERRGKVGTEEGAGKRKDIGAGRRQRRGVQY